jgi:hypothetical protein
MPILSLQTWLTETKLGAMKPRSSQLKAVDDALQQYERARNEHNLFKIKNAFEDWKRSKGPNWKTSDRNRGGAITRMDQELAKVADYRTHQLTGGRFTMQELQALAFIGQERKKVIANVFQGKEVTFRNSPKAVKEAVKDAAEQVRAKCVDAKKFLDGSGKKSTLSPAELAQKKLEEMVKAMFAVDTLESLGGLGGFIIDIVGKCGVSVAPVVGHVKDGYDLFTGWAKAAKALHDQHSISNCHYIIDTGAPAAAFQGVKTCLINETKNETASASIATTSFALKTGLVFVDGGAISGPVVGAANAVASLSLQLYWLATEWKATKAINQALADDKLDVTLFETYPLMGCYLMTSATFSDLIPIDCFGTPGWMDYVENLKKRSFDGIYDAATGLIDKSPWEIKGLPKRPVKGAGLQFGMVSAVKSFGSNVKDVFS